MSAKSQLQWSAIWIVQGMDDSGVNYICSKGSKEIKVPRAFINLYSPNIPLEDNYTYLEWIAGETASLNESDYHRGELLIMGDHAWHERGARSYTLAEYVSGPVRVSQAHVSQIKVEYFGVRPNKAPEKGILSLSKFGLITRINVPFYKKRTQRERKVFLETPSAGGDGSRWITYSLLETLLGMTRISRFRVLLLRSCVRPVGDQLS